MKLWICGKYIEQRESGAVWEFAGVFDSQEKAVAACRDASYFIGEAPLNFQPPHEAETWPGLCCYPLAA